MKTWLSLAVAPVLAVTLSGEAGAQSMDCRAGQRSTQVAELMFGRKIGDRVDGSDDEWRRFVDGEITPRFPDGLTEFDAMGQWLDKAGNKVIHEPSKIVQIVLPGNAEDMARLNEIAEAYKSHFKQQSVGIIVRPACVAF